MSDLSEDDKIVRNWRLQVQLKIEVLLKLQEGVEGNGGVKEGGRKVL